VLIVVVIGMSPNSGASVFSFFARIVGTVIAFAASLIVWYVVVGHTAGVIVLLYFANVFGVSTACKPSLYGLGANHVISITSTSRSQVFSVLP
jgi:uncharacterized membrane protein YccC